MKNVFWRRLCALIGGCPVDDEEEREEEREEETTTEDTARHERRETALAGAREAQERAWRARAEASRAVAELQHKRR